MGGMRTGSLMAQEYARHQRNAEWRVMLDTLATNLRWAAFGCAAFQLGLDTGVDVTCDPYNHERYWEPGCGRPAPGCGRRGM